MNPVYIRMAVYALGGLATVAGLGTVDAEAGTLTIDLEAFAASIGAGLAASGFVFGVWGKK